ncbi:monothiol bacilliredoxin BrxC family protein [Robertmurraya andreesenii]|uniref:Bacillithiol system protein YtxJ n=1 Tax=Anoxybacillus andreesenii TaxID=1325932 RepID=A0ABT9V6I5_9BACL|nr:monothiol bacilliredoxin BrxC family protein [Robertmurraya andreesenii]MDQ0156564.1 bacillithiol system protein YtxJ [Robertmurraya andreesenii]
MIKIESTEEFQQALKEDDHFFLLKHSLTCPISQAAYEEYEDHEKNHGGHEALLLSGTGCPSIIQLHC